MTGRALVRPVRTALVNAFAFGGANTSLSCGCRVSVPFGRPVYVAGAAALTPFGAGWRGAGGPRGTGAPAAAEVPALAPDDDPCQPRIAR